MCEIELFFSSCEFPLTRFSPLAHPVNSAPRVCLFARGTGREARELLEQRGVSAKVIGLKKLAKKYAPYEMRRKLVASYDVFLVDASVAPSCIPLCGKIFYARRKMAVPVDLSGDVSAAIGAAANAATLLPTQGVCWNMRVARSSHSADQIADNVISAVNHAVAHHVAGGWRNIQSVHVKTDKSAALPIYAHVPEVGLEVEGASVPLVPAKRVDPSAADASGDEDELRQLALDAGIDWISSEGGEGDAGDQSAADGADAVADDVEDDEDNADDDDEEEEEADQDGDEQGEDDVDGADAAPPQRKRDRVAAAPVAPPPHKKTRAAKKR